MPIQAAAADSPSISVVIPTYNRADLVVQAVESALHQTFTDREVIVVDDGSTDDTAERMQAYAGRVIYAHQENAGPAQARNHGIALARGAWVAFLDSDDMWIPETLDRLSSAARRHPEAILMAPRAREIRHDGTPTRRTYGKRSPGTEFTTASLLTEDGGGVLTPMVRRPALEQVGGFDTDLCAAEDCDLWLRLSFEGELRALPEPLLLRRTTPASLSGDRLRDARMWLQILDKLEAQRPVWSADNRRLLDRARAKQCLRLGRECLVKYRRDPRLLATARESLRRAVSLRPGRARAWMYLLWSWTAPSSYGAWRQVEFRLRRRASSRPAL